MFGKCNYQKAQSGITDEGISRKLDQRRRAKKEKDFATADAIRQELAAAGLEILDHRDGTSTVRKGI
jgi:cysteinyl-tRNA synthetase